jgi:hypothetical protein
MANVQQVSAMMLIGACCYDCHAAVVFSPGGHSSAQEWMKAHKSSCPGKKVKTS